MGNKHCGSCGRPSFANNRCAGCEIQHRLDTDNRTQFPAVMAGRLMEPSLEGNKRLKEVLVTCAQYIGIDLSYLDLSQVGVPFFRYIAGDGWNTAKVWGDTWDPESYYNPRLRRNAHSWRVYESIPLEDRQNPYFVDLAFWIDPLWVDSENELRSRYGLREAELQGLLLLKETRENLIHWFEGLPQPSPPEDDGGGHDDCPPNCMKCNPTFGMTRGSVTKVARSELRRMEREDQLPHGELTREYKARRHRRIRVHGFGHPG